MISKLSRFPKLSLTLNAKRCLSHTTPVTSLLSIYNQPKITFIKGKGMILTDNDGNNYLDMTAGIAVNALGHSDPKISQILYQQSQELIHLSNLYQHPHSIELSDRLIQYSNNDFDKVFICNSGTEATEAALKFSRKYQYIKCGNKSEKFNFISFKNAFHGRSMGALSVTGNQKYQLAFEPLVPGVKQLELNCSLEILEKSLGKDSNVGGVIVEPIQGEGGIHIASYEFLKNLRKVCDKNDVLLIYDEIQCGLGRSGKLWSYQHYENVKPDILNCAKPLGNGIPIGATLVNSKVGDCIHVGDHGTTFGGNPLACAVANYVVSRINEKEFLNNVDMMGEYLISELCLLQNQYASIIKEVRGKGLMIGVEIHKGFDAKQIVQLGLDLGMLIITCGENTIRIVPPLIINQEYSDQFLKIFKQILNKL
ncbi:acetylornithine aminotransferase apoenzyme [Neoconidiobolus thromboides FSU 785]|nr:acetylornithine aminotransferase apoenzyme [Neoconidiobolus thromboides FSU 785]